MRLVRAVSPHRWWAGGRDSVARRWYAKARVWHYEFNDAGSRYCPGDRWSALGSGRLYWQYGNHAGRRG